MARFIEYKYRDIRWLQFLYGLCAGAVLFWIRSAVDQNAVSPVVSPVTREVEVLVPARDFQDYTCRGPHRVPRRQFRPLRDMGRDEGR